jgi:hypothetical protein
MLLLLLLLLLLRLLLLPVVAVAAVAVEAVAVAAAAAPAASCRRVGSPRTVHRGSLSPRSNLRGKVGSASVRIIGRGWWGDGLMRVGDEGRRQRVSVLKAFTHLAV